MVRGRRRPQRGAHTGSTSRSRAATRIDDEPPDVDVILAGDIGYEWNLATRGADWLRRAADRGTRVLIGDPERHYLPPDGLVVVATYEVPTTLDLEQTVSKHTTVFRVEPDRR